MWEGTFRDLLRTVLIISVVTNNEVATRAVFPTNAVSLKQLTPYLISNNILMIMLMQMILTTILDFEGLVRFYDVLLAGK